jgi:protoporphyrinogen oxidase
MRSHIVIGGGLAGLTAANALVDSGRKVILLEQSERLGGRAITQNQSGYLMNLGPHALYIGGAARRALKAWEVPFSGSRPDLRGRAHLVYRGEKYPFFTGLSALLRSPLFRIREKLELIGILRLLATSERPCEDSMEQWIMRHAQSERVFAFMRAMTRLSTYATDLEHLSAAQAVAQIRSALTSGVLYLDGGWQTLVNGLAARARSGGVEIRNGVSVESLTELDPEKLGNAGVVLAVPPDAVERIAGVSLPKLRPSRMACLQIGLRKLPDGGSHFALGVDQPIYFSAHSAWAKVAPKGAALIHAGKYLIGTRAERPSLRPEGPLDTTATGSVVPLDAMGNGRNDDRANRAELEAFADLASPGWRAEAEVVQFLPNMTVTHGMPACEGRPDVDVVKSDGITVAGDWVGSDGMLVDAAVSSALRAAAQVQNRTARAAA